MPRKKPPVHIYAVFIDHTDERSVMPYLGSSERLAAWHFYKAVRSAEAEPLAYMVTMHKDAKPIARVHIEKL